MLTTPQTRTYVLGAGLREPVQIPGAWLEIISCTSPTILVGFNSDQPQVCYPGRGYPGPVGGFTGFVLVDSGAGCTVVVTVSDSPLAGQSAGILTAMAASLSSIDQEVSGAAADPVTGQLGPTPCAATPGPGTLLFAANPDRTEVEIVAAFANGAEMVYLGVTDARCSAVDHWYPLAAGEPWWSNREKGAIYACSDLGTGVVTGREC